MKKKKQLAFWRERKTCDRHLWINFTIPAKPDENGLPDYLPKISLVSSILLPFYLVFIFVLTLEAYFPMLSTPIMLHVVQSSFDRTINNKIFIRDTRKNVSKLRKRNVRKTWLPQLQSNAGMEQQLTSNSNIETTSLKA